MTTAIERFGEGIKAITIGKRKVQFANHGGGIYDSRGYGLGGAWGSHTPGATYDYAAAAGEILENRVVSVCVNAIAKALQDAPPFLEVRNGAKWEKVDTHPSIDLLNTPNGKYTSFHLWSSTAASEIARGEAYWRIETNRAGVPAELWWEDSRRFRVVGTPTDFIESYWFQSESGAQVRLDNDEVIHFRDLLDPVNPRRGRTPLQTGLRQIALDNGIASYSGSILRNSGVMSLLVSVKEMGAESAQKAPTPGQVEEFLQKVRQKLAGDGAGGIVGLNVPLSVDKMSYSPDEMAVEKLAAYAEASICALCGVHPMVVGLQSGEATKTYSNMGEALNDFWERRIVPTKNRHAEELRAQLLPLYPDLVNPDTGTVTDYRIAWDYSKVEPLQENEDEKHTRIRSDFASGGIDRYTFKVALNYEASEEDKGVYAKPPATQPGEEPDEPAIATKSASWNESAHPRAADGKFGHGATQTPQFRAWFGDSKVVDSSGHPQKNHEVQTPSVVYHGVGTITSPGDAWGMVFTPNREMASGGTGEPMAAFLSIKKPYSMTTVELHESADKADAIKRKLVAQGFDGLHVTHGDYEEWIAFSAPQVKSVEAKEFDGNDPNPFKSGDTLTMGNSIEDKGPEPLPDPHGVGFTPEQLDRLIETNTEAAVTLAFGTATDDVKELLTAKEGK